MMNLNVQRISKYGASGNALFHLFYATIFYMIFKSYQISFEMPFVSSDLLVSILRYVWLTTSTWNQLSATYRELLLLSAK